MPADWARVNTTLANSSLQNENNAAFQSIKALITAAKTSDSELQTQIANAVTQDQLGAYQPGRLVQVAAAPLTLNLVDYLVVLDQLVIFKDMTGAAGGSPITLVGSVEGATDPTISSNWGTYKAYKSSVDGLFHTW